MMPKQVPMKGKFSYKLAGWKYSRTLRFLLFGVLFLLFYFALADKLVPQTYDIQIGMVNEKPILAPRQIENSIETQKAKDLAAQQIEPVYTIVPINNSELVETIFDRLGQINMSTDLNLNDKVEIYRKEFPSLYADFKDRFVQANGSRYHETLLAEIGRHLTDQAYRMPEEMYYKFSRLSVDDLVVMEPVAIDIVNRLMADAVTDAQAARAKVAEMVNASPLEKSSSREAVQEIVRFVLTPNMFLDDQATVEARTKARENTPIVYTNKNDVLVPKGQVITEEIYAKLDSLDLLKDRANYWPNIGLCIMIGLFVFVLYMFIRQSSLAIQSNNVQLSMLVLIYIMNIAMMKIVELGQNLDFPQIGYLAPVAMGIMLITILLDSRLALISSFLFSIMASIIFNPDSEQLFDFRFGFVSTVACIAAIFAIHRASHRSTVLRAGMLVSFFAVCSVAAVLLLDYTSESYMLKDVLLSLSFAVAGGIFTAILVIGIMPFMEIVFGILSPLKLVELSNPNHPLLRKLLTETPGTYHHSIMVGNLSEAAAEAIGANGLLCRVGAFYHDIGKTRRPGYFIENQTHMENPHDHIDPSLSKSIIIAHARDGVDMLKEHKMPKPICDIAEQHHGTTLLKYFYHKALQQQGDNAEAEIDEQEYRYPGPKAQSKEAAIVGLADCVEAAVRSLRNPTVEQIDSMVRKIIKDRLDDGQFNECDLTLKELDTIATTLKEALMGIFHSRIEYPNELAKSE